MNRASLTAVLCVSLSACHGAAVREAFDARLEAALAQPRGLGLNWAPDTTLHLSAPVVQQAVALGVEQAQASASLSLPGMSATPRLTVDQLVLDLPSIRCTGCVGVQGSLSGTLDLSVFGVSTSAALHADVAFDVRLDAQQHDDGWRITAQPQKVRDVSVRFGTSPGGPAGYLDLTPLDRWLSAALLDAPPIPVAQLGDASLPVRGVRLAANASGVRVDVRTEAVPGGQVAPPPVAHDGWTARVSTASVLSLARRALFAQGPLDHGVWGDPTSLTLQGDAFQLGLRLWRPGAGWWRDYTVTGTWRPGKGALELMAREVVETGASPGAGVVDPLAAMAKGAILQGLTAAVHTSIPASFHAQVGDQEVVWRVRSVRSDGDDLVVEGTMRVPGGRQPSK